MRIILITGGLYLLAAMPVAAQEASFDQSLRPAGTTPAATQLPGAVRRRRHDPVGLCVGRVLRSGGKESAGKPVVVA